ncbi:MAG: sulfite exporter TauE/SafE family protein [Burkholderiales bacterium]|nr:sulfite exporter TauE/SafE family protein [Burkholderiales bacterium]
MDALLALLAGGLTTLSPCVLPLLPFVLASAAQQHRYGPLALAAGISLSFVLLGAGVFGLGAALGLAPDRSTLRLLSASLMLGFGAILFSATAQLKFAQTAGRLSQIFNPLLERFTLSGWSGQALLGMLLGAAWTPCSGPTLGAAIGLASSSATIARAGGIMALFSIGAALPLLALAYGSRHALQRRRTSLKQIAGYGKPVLGGMLMISGLMIAFGLDKLLEARLLALMPDWLIDLTTRF